MLENLPEGLTNYTVRLLACQQLMSRIYHRQEETSESGMILQIYNRFSRQEEQEGCLKLY